MKERKRIPFLARQHLFRSEILRYSLLLILPLVLSIALFFGVWSVTVVQMDRDGTAVAEYFQARTDSVLRETEIVSNAILKDGKFLEFMESRSFDPAEMCALINQKVLDSPYVSSAYLLWEEEGRIFNEQANISYLGIPTVLQSFRPSVYENTEDYFYDAANLKPGWYVASSGYSPPHYVADAPHGAKLVVITNMRAFLDTIQEPHATVCCAFNDDVSFSSALFAVPGTDWRSTQSVSSVAGTSVKCFYVEGDNLTYMAAISTDEYYAPLRMIVWVFSIYFVLVLIVGYFYLHTVSRRRYETTMELLQAIPDPSLENATHQEIVAAAAGSLHNYKESLEFEKRINNRELLSGVLTDSISSSPNDAAAAGILPSDTGYYVVRFSVMLSSGNKPDGSRDGRDRMCRILESTLNTLAEHRISAVTTAVRPYFYAVISVLDPMLSHAELLGTLQSLLDILDESYGILFSSVVSSRKENISELSAARDSADRLFSFIRSIDSPARLISQDDIKSNAGTLLNGNFLSQLQMLAQTLIMEKYDIVPQLTESILDEHVASLRKHYELAEERLDAVSGLLAEAVLSSSVASQEEKAASVALLRSCSSISDLNAAIYTVFSPLAESKQTSEIDPIVQRACEYIGENLSDISLSVPQICEAVDVSVSYFSRIFKRDLNTTITDYINSRRIELAKKLLLEGNDTLVHIADASGFANTVTFSRNFKRYMGMTPNEYRTMKQ